jgi:hypothetical protein
MPTTQTDPYAQSFIDQFQKIGKPVTNTQTTTATGSSPLDLGSLIQMIWMMLQMNKGKGNPGAGMGALSGAGTYSPTGVLGNMGMEQFFG